MAKDRRYTTHPLLVPQRESGARALGRAGLVDWPVRLGRIERNRKLLSRRLENSPIVAPPDYFVSATCASFRLDQIDVTGHEVADSLIQDPSRRRFRSRAAQRIRNHVAILRSIESALRKTHALKFGTVVRWYTSISSGLSTTGLGCERAVRLEQIVRRINSPQLRLRPAIQDIARLHSELMADPLFPSFNGILSRLLLRYHLGRCGLPFVVLKCGAMDAPNSPEAHLTHQLLAALDETYELLLD